LARDSICDLCATSRGISESIEVFSSLLDAEDSTSYRIRDADFTRNGPLSLKVLLTLLLYLVADAGRRGYEALLDEFWDECRDLSVPLPTDSPISASAFCQARKKIDPEFIRALLHHVSDEFEQTHGRDFRWNGHRLLAVDGSKVTLQRSAKLSAAVGVPAGGSCPQMLLSTLYDVLSGVPRDITVAPTLSSERVELERMLPRCRPGDILLLDRGYPSFRVMHELRERSIHFVMRMPVRQTFSKVSQFAASGKAEAILDLCPPRDLPRDLSSVRVRVVNLAAPDEEPFILITDLVDPAYTADDLDELYHLRWKVEELYKVEKGDYLGQKQFHAKSLPGVKQEVYAFGLFVAISRRFMATSAKSHAVPFADLSQKRAILAVAAYITRLALRANRLAMQDIVNRLLERIARNIDPPRPGRSFARRSFRPRPPWGPRGKAR
jgi:hypothetical protein